MVYDLSKIFATTAWAFAQYYPPGSLHGTVEFPPACLQDRQRTHKFYGIERSPTGIWHNRWRTEIYRGVALIPFGHG
jgi:hypothetical protein